MWQFYGPEGFWYGVVAWTAVATLWVWVFWTSPLRQRLAPPAKTLPTIHTLRLTEQEREGSTGVYRTEDEVRRLHDFPAAKLVGERFEFVKNELGSQNAAERAAFRIIRTMGRVTENIWRERLAADGFQLDNAVINKLESLITRDFRVNILSKRN